MKREFSDTLYLPWGMFRCDLRNVNGITFSSLYVLPVTDLSQTPIDLLKKILQRSYICIVRDMLSMFFL